MRVSEWQMVAELGGLLVKPLPTLAPQAAACLAGIFCQNIPACLCHAAAEESAFCPLALQMTVGTEVQRGPHR